MLLLLLCALPALGEAQTATSPREVRAVWATRHSLTSPEAIADLVVRARSAGFTDIIAQVRGRGDALYAFGPEPRSTLLAGQPATFDPLATLVESGHQAGLKVHAWINTFFVANAWDLPDDPGHLVNAHPDWLMVPLSLARELHNVDPASPGYARRLAAACPADGTGEVEGLYASPAHPGVREHLMRIWQGILTHYAVDGMHFDFVRYPSPDYDFSPASLQAFARRLGVEPPRAEAPGALPPLLALALAHPEAFAEFQRAQVTRIVQDLSRLAKRLRPEALVTAAVFADARNARERRFQDWPDWLSRPLLDAVCPMAYTRDTVVFSSQIAQALDSARNKTAVWAGIGAWRLPADSIQDKIAAARAVGAQGFALFSWAGLNGQTEESAPPALLEHLRLRP